MSSGTASALSLNRVSASVSASAARSLSVVFDFTIAGGKIVAMELVGDPAPLAQLDLVILDA
jgi:hypothetical protein